MGSETGDFSFHQQEHFVKPVDFLHIVQDHEQGPVPTGCEEMIQHLVRGIRIQG